jgi:hypothetical protein
MNLLLPFNSKELPDGKKLFRKKHGYTFTLNPSGDTVLSIINPYGRAKIMDAVFLWFPEGCTYVFKIKDTSTGTYSTVPNYVLGQHSFGVAIAKDFYHDKSPYDADIYLNMVLEVTITNLTDVTKTVAINVPFHEVV